MNTLEQYTAVARKASSAVTRSYSTSFSIGVRSLHPRFRDPIHAIYGFVRLADEIVDTFHGFDKRSLFDRFSTDTWKAIDEGISLNPILHNFQEVVRTYAIDRSSITAFLNSMAMDLDTRTHDRSSYETYIRGSAEVVGLMCLRVFCENDDVLYQRLKESAMRLGAAFQKINFLRDLRDDRLRLGRAYFPGTGSPALEAGRKEAIEQEIREDLDAALEGIKGLPRGARFGVYVAFRYYRSLFKRIRSTPAHDVMDIRISVPNTVKAALLMKSYVRHSLNMIG